MPGTLVQCRCSRPVHLHVQAGRLWLTCAGQPDDHFLTSGESWQLPAGCHVTLGCDGASALRLQWHGAPARGWASRWHQWRQARALRRVLATLSDDQMRDAGLSSAHRLAEQADRARRALQHTLSARWAQG